MGSFWAEFHVIIMTSRDMHVFSGGRTWIPESGSTKEGSRTARERTGGDLGVPEAVQVSVKAVKGSAIYEGRWTTSDVSEAEARGGAAGRSGGNGRRMRGLPADAGRLHRITDDSGEKFFPKGGAAGQRKRGTGIAERGSSVVAVKGGFSTLSTFLTLSAPFRSGRGASDFSGG